MPTQRRLAAVLVADVAGYSRLMGAYEERTLDRLSTIRVEVIDPTIAANNGRLVKTTGDGLLVEFASVVDAVRCAIEVQHRMAAPQRRRARAASGSNSASASMSATSSSEDGDIFGDGVNIAARLEALGRARRHLRLGAGPGGCADGSTSRFEDMGEQQRQEHRPAGPGLSRAASRGARMTIAADVRPRSRCPTSLRSLSWRSPT